MGSGTGNVIRLDIITNNLNCPGGLVLGANACAPLCIVLGTCLQAESDAPL